MSENEEETKLKDEIMEMKQAIHLIAMSLPPREGLIDEAIFDCHCSPRTYERVHKRKKS